MRIMYFGENKEEGTGRVAVIRFTDKERDLYDYIANYENTYGDETRKFYNGRVFAVDRDENGVTINEAYIDVDDFSDFNDFKANYKEAKKEFKSLKKQATESESETLDPVSEETEDTHIDDIKKFKEKADLNSSYGEGTETVTKQYECENVVQVAHKVAELTNTCLDCQTWAEYCDEVKKDGSSWFDYTAFDIKGNECDVSIFLGYYQQSRHYFASVDYGKRPVSNFLSYECEKNFEIDDYDVITDEKFHQLTKTLIKSLFKAIGIDKTRKIHFIISNNMVLFNYNGTQYKYYPSQCKVFKKCGRKYQRIIWKNFVDDNSPTDQKQALGRSPPLLLI